LARWAREGDGALIFVVLIWFGAATFHRANFRFFAAGLFSSLWESARSIGMTFVAASGRIRQNFAACFSAAGFL
jgi:hypothetical protein